VHFVDIVARDDARSTFRTSGVRFVDRMARNDARSTFCTLPSVPQFNDLAILK
jgi:hypothetical protein